MLAATGSGVEAGVAAGVGVGVGVAVGDWREPPPTPRGEDAEPDAPGLVSLQAAPERAKPMESAHAPAVRRKFMPPGPLRS